METYHNYNIKKYDFISLLQELFECNDLQYLHNLNSDKLSSFKPVGFDSDTFFHSIFYEKMRSGWPEFINLYESLIRDFIAPCLGIKDKIVYQKWPTFRVHLPNDTAVGGWHCDSQYNHPPKEVNFILALTEMFESNTTIVESSPGKKDFHQVELKPGEIFQFNGNECMHGNLPNKTGLTRVSFDFRVLKFEDYSPNYSGVSLSKKNKFLIGEYYNLCEL